MEVSDAAAEDSVFAKADTSATRQELQKDAQTARLCAEIIDRYNPLKRPLTGFLQGRICATVQDHDAFAAKRADVLHAAQHVIALEQSIQDAKAELIRLDAQHKALYPWLQLPVPPAFTGTKSTAMYIGCISGQHTSAGLQAKLSAASPQLDAFHVQVIYTSKEQTCFYMIALRRDAHLAEEALRLIGFAALANPGADMPQMAQERIAQQKQAAQALIDRAQQEIRAHAARREEYHFLEDHTSMREEKYTVMERLLQSKHTFILTGYISQRDASALRQAITERFTCAVETTSAADDADAPVMLHNNRFTEPVESVLESYSMPARGELDPTPVLSVFYYIMFGLMFSDAGYGLIMAGACGACLLAYKNMPLNWKKNLRLFFWCGVSTVFWGVLLSSYFGDVVNVFSRTFLGREVGIPPVWFAPLDSPMKLLVFCLGIGIVHLLAGYGMKACNCIKQKQYSDTLYDVGFPVGILIGLLLPLMGSEMFFTMAGFTLSLSAAANTTCLGVALLCMLGVILTGGRESKNWFKRILKGLYALYNVLAGWLGDILSYSRLLALGLATGVIASVINALGVLLGGGIIGFLSFILVFAVGHAMNFGINVLGAYVHSNRLEYVEFFGKFYEGGGRKFLPYGIHTKYYRIQEEDCNV